MAYVEEVMNDYRNSLRDLNFNSKPLINMLTMLAEENEQHAPCIVKVIEDEIIKVKANRKLPILYLIDSIIKNLPKTSYKSLFSKNLVHTFTTVFEQVDEKTRASMYKLRQTWTPLFPNATLYGIDVKIQSNLDPAWPVTATPPKQTSIHVNPNFLKKSETATYPDPEPEMSPEPTPEDSPKEEEDNLEEQESLMRQQLIAKQQELLKLQQARLELELAEAKEKLQKQKKKNTKMTAQDEPVLPDTTVHPSSLDSVPAPRDPRKSNVLYSRTAGRDPHTTDPRLKGSAVPTQSSHVPHSTTPGGLPLPSEAAIPPSESAYIPGPYNGQQGMPHYAGAIAPGMHSAIAPGMQPPFLQSGQLHINPGFLAGHGPPPPAEGHFKGEVYHPDSSDDNDVKSQDSGPVSKSDNQKSKPKMPSTNRRDPRQARKEMEQESQIDDSSMDSNRSTRDNNSRNKRDSIDRNSNYDRNSNRNSNRSSRDRDQRSRSPHSSSRSPRTSESGRDKTDSKSRDPRLKRHPDDDRRKDTGRLGSTSSSHSKNDDRRRSRDKSPERSPKYSKRSEKDRPNKDEDISKTHRDVKRLSKERSASPSKHKVRNVNDNAKKSGSVERTDKAGKEVKVKTPKRELENDDLVAVEDESLSKKARIEPEKPIVEGADVLGKIQSDISELFGGEDQDYRPTDAKGLPLKSPSSKGWDKFKADHSEQFAYDIELKRQRSESMDVDQRQPQEEQDTDYRLQTQTSWSDVSNNGSRRESAEEVSIPVELSMEHHAEILIQAHKHLQEGKLTHEQHQLLLQQLGELMKIQKLQEETRKIQQLQEASRRLSLEAERIKQESQASMGEDIMNMSPIKPEVPLDRDLRQPLPVTPENAQRVPPNIDSTPPGPLLNRPPADFGPPVGKIPDDGRDRFQGTAIRDQSHPDVRENQQGGIAPQDMPPMQPPPRPFFVKDGSEPFDGPKRDIGPFDRGDHNRNDFRPADRRGMGPPPSEMSPSGRFDNISGEVQDFDGRRGPEDGMGSNQQRLHGQPDMSNTGPQSSDHGDGRDFDGRPGPMDRMGSGQRMPYGPQNVQDNEPLRQGFGHPHHENDNVPPFDRGCEPTLDRGFPEKDRRDFGPPNGFEDRPQGEMEMGPPNRFDEGPQGGERQDRMDMQGDRRDFDFHGRRDGPPGERNYRLPDRMHRGPPGKMGHGPPDRDFDRRDEPPGGRGRGRGFGPPGRMDMENNRVLGRRDPDWREPGPQGMGPQDRNAGPQGIGHPDRDRGGRIDRNYGPPGMGHRGGPPGMDHQDKDQWHHPDGDRNQSGRGRDDGPEVMGYPDRNQGPPGRRGLEWRDHGPPGRHGPGGPDFRPDRPHGDGDFGPGGRRDGFSDRRDVGPERRDDNSCDRQDGHPGRFQDGPPGRFQDGRNFQHEDRMGPHRFDERRSPEKFRHDRRDERPGQQGRLDGPSDGRNWGQNEGREFGPAGRGHGPPGFREHGPMDRMPHGRDQRPMDRIGPENNREGTPDWNERRPGWRGERNSDRRNEPEQWADQPDWRDGPNDRKDVPHDRDERRAGPPGRDTRDEKPNEEKRPEWPLGDIQHPFNPCKAELENIEKMVSERKTPPIDEVIQQDSEETIPLKVDQEPETRKTSVEQDAKPDKVTRNQKEQEQTDNVENTGQKVGLLPTPPAHFKVEPLSDHDDEDQRKSEAFVKKDTKHIPALLAMPTIKPTKELSVEQIKELPEGDMETDEDKDPKTGLGKWKTSKVEPKKKSSKKIAKKVEKKDDDSDDDAEERQHNPFAVGSFLKEMLPPSKDKPTKKIEKKKPEKEQKTTVKEEKPETTNVDNEKKQLGKNEKTQDRNEKKLPVRDEKRPQEERRDRGRDKKDKPHENEMRPHGRDEMGPPGRDKMRPHGRDGNRPHVRDDMRPPGMEGMRPPGPWEGPPRHPDGRHMGPRPRGPMPHGQMMDGPRGPMMDRPRGPMMDRPRGPLMDGPRGPMMDGPHGPHPQGMNTSPRKNQDEDPRWTSYSDMGPEVSEEVVIGNKNYAIKLGDRPRVVKFFNESIEVYADAAKRGIVIDGNLMYKFGERVKEVELRGRTVRMFYHGKPVNLWIDGQNYEIRVDAPPRNIEINGNNHKIQIDGRDMMILIDKVEKGPYGGPPRFIFIDEDRMEIRFDPPPRHILIDGKLCELMLALKRPCVNIEGKLHGIRFDGPPREVVINNQVFMIHTDRAVKVRVDNKLHYICLGGPCHELIIDGKWYEMKFSEPPKEINVGNRILSVHLPGNPPEVKILPEISPMPGPLGIPMGPGMMGPGPMRPMGPGMEPMMRGPVPMGPGQGPMGPIPQNERLPFPLAPRPEVSQAGAFPLNRPPMSAAQPMIPTFPGPDSQPRPSLPQPPVSMGAPVTSTGGMPNVLASMFPNIPQPQLPATSTPAAPSMDINTLLQKLVATGIIKKEPEPVPTTTAATVGSAGGGVKPLELMNVRRKVEKQESLEDIPDMTEMDISLMKELPNGVIQRIYAGIQCTTCGVRFVLDDEEKTEKYREHLDWHFRQKRREKDEMKVARNRHWYYGVNDWLQYEEITDTEETSRSTFFERQQQMVQQPTPTTPSNMSFALITVPEGATVTRCPAATGNDSDDLCAICHEPFEQFWDEELEEWHLRDAIRVNDQTYHPICYEDHTDVSEGTPSPSALPMLPPDFSARKTLSYDESSQDAVNTSFVGEREVVKTEPVLETDSKDAVRAATKDVISISDSPVKPVTHAAVKSEPMDTTDSAIVKQEIETPTEETTIVPYEVTSIVTAEPASAEVSQSEIDSTSVSEPITEENQSNNAITQSVDQEMTDTNNSASQLTQESAQNDTVGTPEKVAMETATVPMATDPVVVASAVPESVIKGTAEAVGSSPLPQESGGSTPVQDERSRSNTPTKDECPGTPVMDEPMVE